MPRRPRPDSIPRKRYYTTGDVARILAVAPRTAAKWIDSGVIPGFRLPGSLDRRVGHDEFAAWLADRPEFGVRPGPDGWYSGTSFAPIRTDE